MFPTVRRLERIAKILTSESFRKRHLSSHDRGEVGQGSARNKRTQLLGAKILSGRNPYATQRQLVQARGTITLCIISVINARNRNSNAYTAALNLADAFRFSPNPRNQTVSSFGFSGRKTEKPKCYQHTVRVRYFGPKTEKPKPSSGFGPKTKSGAPSSIKICVSRTEKPENLPD